MGKEYGKWYLKGVLAGSERIETIFPSLIDHAAVETLMQEDDVVRRLFVDGFLDAIGTRLEDIFSLLGLDAENLKGVEDRLKGLYGLDNESV